MPYLLPDLNSYAVRLTTAQTLPHNYVPFSYIQQCTTSSYWCIHRTFNVHRQTVCENKCWGHFYDLKAVQRHHIFSTTSNTIYSF